MPHTTSRQSTKATVAELVLLLSLVATACSTTPIESTTPSTETSSQATTSAPAPDEGNESGSTTPAETESDESAATETTGETPATQPNQDVCAATTPQGRVDVRPDGNRLSPVSVNLAVATAVDVALPDVIEWVVPSPDGGWYATTLDGQSYLVTAEGLVDELGPTNNAPPVVAPGQVIGSAYDAHALFAEPLADGRVVQSGSIAAVLASPTDRYGHGVLGDAIEAAAVEWVDLCDETTGRIEISSPDVIEGIAPILADVDHDGTVEVLVTLANQSGGARLAVYELDGSVRAESAPIGQGNRWRNQLAVGPFGPAGETEIVDVQTPHIGGIVQAFRLVDSDEAATLERVARSAGDFTTHPIRTRNLDMGIALDVNADDRLDVLVASFSRDRLVGLTRSDETEGWAQVGEVSLPGALTSNISVSQADGGSLAAGAGQTLRMWQFGDAN